jgi:hypothetical protein
MAQDSGRNTCGNTPRLLGTARIHLALTGYAGNQREEQRIETLEDC